MKSEKELFELWCIKDDKFCIHRYTEKCEDYSEWDTQAAWRSWQASSQREGYKLVPVEINDEIESAMLSSVARGEMPCDIYKAMIGAQESKG